MKKDHLPSASPNPSPRASRAKGGGLLRSAELWLADGQAAGWSRRTISARRDMLAKFAWWLEKEGDPTALAEISTESIRYFLAYLRGDGTGARWGGEAVNATGPARPSTVDTYYRCLRTFFNFAVREGLLADSPMRSLKRPRVPKDQIQPFTPEQAQALVDAAKRSRHGSRDTALVLILLDTGLRAGELCSLRIGDIDPDTKALSVEGKGGKRRIVYLSATVRRALWKYVEAERRGASDDEPLFVARRGRAADSRLPTNGVYQLFQRLGSEAALRDVRCSPHTARQFFAVAMLRHGANLFELQQLMGHEDLTVLRRYVLLAEADLAQVHRKASPAARLRV